MKSDILLEKYFSGELDASEQLEFDSLLKTDADFKAEFELQQDIQQAIKLSERADKKRLLQRYEEDRAAVDNAKASKRKWLPIAAAIALLFSLGIYIGSNIAPSGNSLYDNYYEMYPNTVYSITRSGGEESPERSAFEAYEGGDYPGAINYFNQLHKQDGLKNLHFYLGQAYLANEEYENAVIAFKSVIKANEDFTQESRWYAALSYLKQDNIKEAKNVLKEIAAKNTYKKEAAMELLEKLD
ncbi:tetratricopeptide repeat protein [Spongiivirga sp. MCCC 1A20706]|uniref:tetratricopeptide repeat protein n=1 Tax=Spongiivirga sp. MCCC 1A20706 TaxID=3160963 RepID=UPI003977B1DF